MSFDQILNKKYSDNITNNTLLSNYSWFNLGGPAEYLFKPKNKEQLLDFLRENKNFQEKLSFLIYEKIYFF